MVLIHFLAAGPLRMLQERCCKRLGCGPAAWPQHCISHCQALVHANPRGAATPAVTGC